MVRTIGVIAAIMLSGCVGMPVPATTAPLPAQSEAAAIDELNALLTQARARAGCSALGWDARVAAVARAHSEDMLKNSYLGHDDTAGLSPFDRLRAGGIAYSAAAENVAAGPRTGREAFDLWMNSSRHRRNMMDCRYTRHGLARAGDRWTHMFYRP